MSRDARGWRIALLADALMNPQPRLNPQPRRHRPLPDMLGILSACGYGLMQLPPPGAHRELLAVIADQLAEYAHHGYAVVAIGSDDQPGSGLHWRSLVPLLRHRGMAPPPRHVVRTRVDVASEAQRLTEMLAGYDLPESEQRRWRV